MTTNKDLLMQPLSDEELAGVSGGAGGRSNEECEGYCSHYQDTAPMVYMKCMINCKRGGSLASF